MTCGLGKGLPVLIVAIAMAVGTAGVLWYRHQPRTSSAPLPRDAPRVTQQERSLVPRERRPVPPGGGTSVGAPAPSFGPGNLPPGAPFSMASPSFERQETCRRQVRRLTDALAMYAMDYDDRLPPASRWCDATYPYVRSNDWYHCPAKPGRYGYALNLRLDRVARTTIRTPERTVVLFESSSGKRNAADPGSSLCQSPRHPMGNVVSYLDGRVAIVPSTVRF